MRAARFLRALSRRLSDDPTLMLFPRNARSLPSPARPPMDNSQHARVHPGSVRGDREAAPRARRHRPVSIAQRKARAGNDPRAGRSRSAHSSEQLRALGDGHHRSRPRSPLAPRHRRHDPPRGPEAVEPALPRSTHEGLRRADAPGRAPLVRAELRPGRGDPPPRRHHRADDGRDHRQRVRGGRRPRVRRGGGLCWTNWATSLRSSSSRGSPTRPSSPATGR